MSLCGKRRINGSIFRERIVMKKKLIVFALASLMAVSLFGCGKKNEVKGTTKVSASKDYV